MSQLAVHYVGHLTATVLRKALSEGLTRAEGGTPPAQWRWTQWGESIMRRQAMIILAALATAAAGCHKDNAQNDALQNDLNLANQANAARMDSISAVERGYATPAPAATAPRTATRTSSTARSTAPARRTTSSSSNGSVGTSNAPAQTTT